MSKTAQQTPSFFMRAGQLPGDPMEAFIEKGDKKFVLYADPATLDIEVRNITAKNTVGKTVIATGRFAWTRSDKPTAPAISGFVKGTLGTAALVGWYHGDNPADAYFSIQFKKGRQGQLATPPGH
jgi:hypothetical protein